ncbi:[FeFe] hydrogenase H-cluster maturation GTPase HydF [Halodesulfovibrio aestuarii]|uniref:[FeFe] hydrogenase H-cluster maturation GTPase HydF n=1 Tax=Halodesulfovibrio aestuarii TaxID=126333 RepID=A0A8G2C7W7_9BACT|nr:[FeFe] hydrogenase H-cluster maturation GTPase HydF [Halodesulfovibrio aestuarii]SHI71881.1 [FeFe] hydrogenase H-cluster maturation GTPase HydF [Halodesulfovibrio aestuarii]
MSEKAPRGIRMVITLVGRRNAGKSSLINALAGQDIAIVSDHPGTTTDPVAKHYELLPLGPVTFYDTAGLDDTGTLGELRIKAAQRVLYRTDTAILVVSEEGMGDAEHEILNTLQKMNIATIVVFNKADIATPKPDDIAFCANNGLPHLTVCTASGQGVNDVKKTLIATAPKEFVEDPVLVSDLISHGETVLCVVPIDRAAPKGRIILPQVQVLRDVLDNDALGIVVKEHELPEALGALRHDPALVITDSQAIAEVVADVPKNVPLTTFSTLFARYKGDLPTLVEGARAIDSLKDGDKVLMCEACSHHAVEDDIGRVKLPKWITQYTGKELEFVIYAGHDFPEDLECFALAVHCGGCMSNRTEMLRRIRECTRREVPITNYGVAISKVHGVLDRVVQPLGL